MNRLVIFLGLLAVACAAPSLRTAPALDFIESRDDFGQYAFRYYTAEGTLVEERGHLVQTPDGNRVLVVDGSSTYTGPDGKIYSTKYSAGTDGFHVEADHLPKAPKVESV